MSSFEDFVQRLLPILSNLVFLFAAARFMEKGDKIRAGFYLLIALFTSPVYHLCMGFPKTCFWTVFKYHVVDFWSAELSIPLTALLFVRFRDPDVERWIIFISIIVIGILVTGTDSSFAGQAVIGGVSIGLAALYIIWHVRSHGYLPEYDIFQLTLAIGFTAVGVSFFVVQDWWPPYYGYTHSCWHALVAVGVFFFAGIRPPEEGDALEARTVIQAAATMVTNQVEKRFSVLRPKWKAESRVSHPVAPERGTLVYDNWYERLAFAPMSSRKVSLP